MKMKFNIPYRANWGEKLCVCLRFINASSENDEYVEIPMSTRDGYLWEAETSGRENKRHPYHYIHYYYEVVDAKGAILRIESMNASRAYPYDSTKNYYFDDTWLDAGNKPLLATKDFKLPSKLELETPSAIDRLPLFEKTTIFKVRASKLHPGECVALLGNHPTLGSWNTEHFLLMTPSSLNKDEYVLSVDVAPIDIPIEYKYVVIDGETMRFKRWEYGENRVLPDAIYKNDVYVQNGGELRTKPLANGIQFDFDTYVFDLDGTLLSTLEDLAASCNYALRVNKLQERTLDEVRMMVGNGVKLLMKRATGIWGDDDENFGRIFRDFRNYYMAHSLDHTRPYPGVMEMLEELKDRGKNIAVVSNKFCEATQALCKHFFGDLVDVAIGEKEKEGIRKKPAPDTVNEAIRLLHADKDKAVYIGDSDVDIETAKNSGMPCISVLWGFRDQEFLQEHGANIYVSSPEQLM